MRHLTIAAAVLLAAAVAAAPAGAEPTDPAEPAGPVQSTEPAESSASTEPAQSSESAESTEPAESTESATTEPATAEDTGDASGAGPAGASQVTYTVTTTSDLTANIYYVSADPPDQEAANDPEFMPLARTVVGPGAPWTMQTTLDDPSQWAFVSASGGLRVNPEFRCEIAVDGRVVVSEQGGSGVQCALRPW